MTGLTRGPRIRSEDAAAGAAPPLASSPEFGVLLGCACVALDDARAGGVEALLRHGVDWPRLLHLADAHGMTPLVARHLTSGAIDAVPADVRARLRADALATAARNMAAAHQLVSVVAVLGAAGVPCLPFKGPLVAADVYGDLALRPFGDLDLAVPRAALLPARRALMAAGYRSAYGLSETQELTLLETYGHLVLIRAGGEAPVELHWGFAPDCFPSLTVADALARARPVRLGGQAVPSLGPEDLLLTLCVHGGKHVWCSLEWVCGVAELLRRGDVDVEGTLRLADRVGAGRFVRLGLRIASELLGAPLPAAVRALVHFDDTATRLAAVVYRVLASVADAPEAADRPARELTYHLRLQTSIPRRLRFLHHVALLPTLEERARVELPDWLAPAYRIVRPARLVGRYVRRRVPSRSRPTGAP